MSTSVTTKTYHTSSNDKYVTITSTINNRLAFDITSENDGPFKIGSTGSIPTNLTIDELELYAIKLLSVIKETKLNININNTLKDHK